MKELSLMNQKKLAKLQAQAHTGRKDTAYRWEKPGADSLTSLRRLAEALPNLWMKNHHLLLETMVMMKFQILWRILT
ncbi:hypothetical protein J0S82_004273, partial [Galemys pyrenaicus]